MLFRIWSDEPYRATRDLDPLAFGDPAAGDLCGCSLLSQYPQVSTLSHKTNSPHAQPEHESAPPKRVRFLVKNMRVGPRQQANARRLPKWDEGFDERGYAMNQTATNKSRLQAILRGEKPDVPPHFELVFQLAKEAFGIEFMPWDKLQSASAAERDRDAALQIEMCERLVDDYGWAALTGDMPALKKAVGDKALVYAFNGSGTFWLMPGNEMMDFVVRLFEKPEDLHAEARVKCDASIELAKQQVDQGADFICINSDYGFNSGPFISPAHFADLVTPYLTEIVTAIHDLGVPAILHSDGNLNAILDLLVSTGLDGYQSVDPQGSMDIKAVRERYPNLILMGNVECSMLQDTNEKPIRESVRYCMAHGGIGERYIFSSSNCIFAGMPLESYHTMLDEYRVCCREAQSL